MTLLINPLTNLVRYFAVASALLIATESMAVVGKNAPAPPKSTAPIAKVIKPQAATIEWLTIEEAAKRNKTNPRKILVDVYTDWCGWCKKMDKTTFANPEVAEYVNKNFYAVKFNAEGTENIIFNNKVYKYNKGKEVHDLAVNLLKGQMGYPTVAYLNEKLELIMPIPGYFNAQDYQKVLSYINDGQYKKQPLDKYLGK